MKRPSAVLFAFGLIALAYACSSSDDGSGSDLDSGVAETSTPSVDASGGGESDRDATTEPGTVAILTNVMFEGYAVDLFIPSNAERAVVFLHGGGGTKEGAAAKEIGLVSGDDRVPESAFLLARHTAFVLPQGKAVAGSPKATTWSNYVMTSGVDDVAFLGKLSAAVRAGTLDAALPAVGHVYLAGHSNGGMMANRVWCEAPAAFDGYGAVSGPPSVQLAPASLTLDGGADDPLTGTHACAPSTIKPILTIIGKQDTILQTKTFWSSDLWAVNSCLSGNSGGGFVDPQLINDVRFHTARVWLACGASPSAPTDSANGETTTWSDCNGRVRLDAIRDADHCVIDGALPCLNNKLLPSDCTNSLEAESGTHLRDVLVDFFQSTES